MNISRLLKTDESVLHPMYNRPSVIKGNEVYRGVARHGGVEDLV